MKNFEDLCMNFEKFCEESINTYELNLDDPEDMKRAKFFTNIIKKLFLKGF